MIRKKRNKKMTAAKLLQRMEKLKTKKISGQSMAMLPAKTREEVEDFLEDVAMSQSRHLAERIKRARADIRKGRYATLEEVKRRLFK